MSKPRPYWTVTSGGHGPEGLDDLRPPRRLVLRHHPHRLRRPGPCGHLLHPRAHGPARRHLPAAAADDGGGGVQRGLLRRGPHAGRHGRGPGQRGWKVAMATLGFERGTAFMAMQLAFEREWRNVAEVAHKNGSAQDPVIRDRLARAFAGVRIMAYNGMRMQTALARTGVVGPEASIGKLYWSTWHRNLGELAMDILGPAGQIVPAPATGSTSSTTSSGPTCSAGRRPSTPARARSNATSSVSVSSDCPGNPDSRETQQRRVSELRLFRGAGGAAAVGAPVPGGQVAFHRGAAPDGDHRGVRPQGVVADGERAGPPVAPHPRGLRRAGLLVRGAGGGAGGDGRALLCAPYFASVCLAANAILNAGSEEQKQALLRGSPRAR